MGFNSFWFLHLIYSQFFREILEEEIETLLQDIQYLQVNLKSRR